MWILMKVGCIHGKHNFLRSAHGSSRDVAQNEITKWKWAVLLTGAMSSALFFTLYSYDMMTV
jgi:hypothetical protein